ncbi:TetR/AcrR family transcriptional regulator [Sesbania bispinosa]|nr:TetR/AcrR family transcriptional regulator [Sesbania bispinosa]
MSNEMAEKKTLQESLLCRLRSTAAAVVAIIFDEGRRGPQGGDPGSKKRGGFRTR